MVITYKLNDHRVIFHRNKESDLWTAKSVDLDGLSPEAKSLHSMLKMLKNQYPELATTIHIFFLIQLKLLLNTLHHLISK